PDSGWKKKLEKAAGNISRNAEKMETLIERNLETAVIESGKQKLSEELLDLGELADFVVKTCKPLAEQKNQAIHFRSQEGCIVKGDSVRMEQVMDNLLCNAVKFSAPGQSIWVEVKCCDSVTTFEVRDEKPGLNETDKANLFKEYFPLTPNPTGGETSTGLGLSIAQTFVKRHGEKIRVESEPGVGSTFIVEFPVAKK
ncbi:sensor histidine kinase, partial [Acidobacteriota bacterium]